MSNVERLKINSTLNINHNELSTFLTTYISRVGFGGSFAFFSASLYYVGSSFRGGLLSFIFLSLYGCLTTFFPAVTGQGFVASRSII